jgi:ketosteroid isomerase-like protein
MMNRTYRPRVESTPAFGIARHLTAIVVSITPLTGCMDRSPRVEESSTADMSRVAAEVEVGVRAFHSADTARDAEAVIGLLWPDFTMLVDGNRRDFDEIAAGSREFMTGLEFFHTEWTDLRIVPLGPDAAVASFQFRDSIMTASGDLIRSRGPTTMVWERRGGQWRIRFADADHYPIDQPR